MPTNPKFYTSRTWRKFREVVITESGGMCSKCNRVYPDTSQLEVHHKKYLKNDDYNKPELAYNLANVEVICHECHNKEHSRFGYDAPKEVILVYGPPLSGKTSFVIENKYYTDIVLDLDKLQEAITLEPTYSRNTKAATQVLFRMRDTLLDIVKVRYGGWRRAWIIGTYPNTFDRDRLIETLGVTEIIFMDVSKDECIRRLDRVPDERLTYKTEWIKYIDDWFKQYTPPSIPFE